MHLNSKNLVIVIFGTFVLALSLTLFLAPANIAPGGISGLSIVINHLTGIPLGILILVFNIPIFFWGLRHFNRRFLCFSILGMFLLSVFTELLSFLPVVTNDTLLSAICGGTLMGVGIGLVFYGECTTGGTEIVAQILKKKYPSVSVGKFVLLIDSLVVALAGLVFGKWEVILYSGIALYISTRIIDVIAEGGNFGKLTFIISDKQELIAEKISASLSRGTTVLNGYSHYSSKDKSVLLCVVKKYEITKLKTIIKEIDSLAFVIVSDVREVLGEGFSQH